MPNNEATLNAAATKPLGNSYPEPTLNPTPDSGTRYTQPILTAQQSGLPIIDISSFLDPSSPPASRQTTAQAINAACTNYGFFYLTGHGIPTSQLDDIISLARDFFALPLEEKNRIKRFDAGGPEGGDGARGYQGLGENVTGGLQDMQEAVDWYCDWPTKLREKEDVEPGSTTAKRSLQGVNLWPERPWALKPVYQAYIERVKEVGEALVHAMGVALELGPVAPGANRETEDEEVFKRNCEDSFWVMRMIGYPPLSSPLSSTTTPSTTEEQEQEQEEQTLSQYSCGAHTDYGCVTLLLTDATPSSLQVQLKNGSWLSADPIPGTFVVNIGDMIERWTNGKWKSTLHRVIHRGERYRVSVPFFYEPGFESVVRPLEKFCKEGEKREGGTYGEHLLTKVFSNFYYSKRTDW